MGGRYRLIEHIGSGGMSVVWRGIDEVLGRSVAIKMLAAGYVNNGTFRERMRREARAAARLCHPQVSTVYDYGETLDGTPYVVMELIDGRSLADELRVGPLPWQQAVAICAQVAAGMGAAHAGGLVHRDIKPSNVMLSSTGGAKLVDFGISAEVGECEEDAPTGSVLGTPAYVAPERLTGSPAQPATDVYALGLLLYKALTGRLPWQVDTRTQILRAHLLTNPEPLPRTGGLPEEVAQLCDRCLAKDPADRPSSRELARVWGRSTEDELEKTGILPVPPIPSRRPLDRLRRLVRRPGQFGAVAGSMLAVSGLAMATAFASQPEGGWGATPAGSDARPVQAALAAQPGNCQATYRMRTDDGRSFTGDLTIRNTGSTTIPAALLVFTLPGDQVISGAGWTQSGAAVRRPVGDVAPGTRAMLPFSGTYDSANPMPTAFALGDTACDPLMIGVTGRPGAGSGPGDNSTGAPAQGNPGSSSDTGDHDRRDGRSDKGRGSGRK
jgi:serine/threonine-protein kinase